MQGKISAAGRHIFGALAGLAAVAVASGLWGMPEAVAAPATPATEGGEMLAVARGARLYDNWARETKDVFPEKAHPLYPADRIYADRPWMNWRCVECHGWDYKGKDGVFGSGPHFTGIKGINDMAGADPAKVLEVLKSKPHGYDTVLDADELHDLAMFVSKGQVDMDLYVDREAKKAKGDPTKRQAYYQTICANCHGTDGLKLRSMPPFGMVAKDDPWQALHKILNGHPGDKMPALRVLEPQVLVDILAHIQTLPREELLSSIVRGGRLYDDWMKELDLLPPTASHPSYPLDGRFANKPRANWRCVECHGYDYKGKDGEYGKDSKHFTGIKGVLGKAGADVKQVMDIIDDRTHRYRGLLADHDILDLANFITQGLIDDDKYIDRATKKMKGDPNRNRNFYQVVCANCHGLDGEKIITMKPLGRTVSEEPWNALHKIINGHPAEEMPALRALDKQILTDILTHIQTLPQGK